MIREPFESGVPDTPARRRYEPPAVTEVFVDPAKDMLVACAPGKLPNSGHVECSTAQFT